MGKQKGIWTRTCTAKASSRLAGATSSPVCSSKLGRRSSDVTIPDQVSAPVKSNGTASRPLQTITTPHTTGDGQKHEPRHSPHGRGPCLPSSPGSLSPQQGRWGQYDHPLCLFDCPTSVQLAFLSFTVPSKIRDFTGRVSGTINNISEWRTHRSCGHRVLPHHRGEIAQETLARSPSQVQTRSSREHRNPLRRHWYR
jgi:hypothetical protein